MPFVANGIYQEAPRGKLRSVAEDFSVCGHGHQFCLAWLEWALLGIMHPRCGSCYTPHIPRLDVHIVPLLCTHVDSYAPSLVLLPRIGSLEHPLQSLSTQYPVTFLQKKEKERERERERLEQRRRRPPLRHVYYTGKDTE